VTLPNDVDAGRVVASLGRSFRDLPPRALPGRAAASLSALAFWVAVVLPVFYLSLLVAGIETTGGLALFLGLLGLHLLALVGGRGYANGS